MEKSYATKGTLHWNGLQMGYMAYANEATTLSE